MTWTMTEKILKVLELIEQKHNIRIIYACESGSRAWGFESKDSDWDIRFVYVSNLDSYLSIFPIGSDVLDTNNSELIKNMNKFDLDFVGWDIRKVLYQISKGNPDLISWFYSPIVYRFAENAQVIKFHTLGFFKPVSAYYHYLHMATRNYNQYIRNPDGPLVNTKKYLYVLRPILACVWIELIKSIPPMKFEDIYTNKIIKDYMGYTVYDEICQLIFNKMSGIELDEQERSSVLDNWVEKQFIRYEQKAKEIDFKIKMEYQDLEKTFKQFAKGIL